MHRRERRAGTDPVTLKSVGSPKTGKNDQRKDEKPIRLNDLIPSKNVSGGRRTVFGSQPPRRKPQK